MASKLPTAAEILTKFYEAEAKYMSASPEQRDFEGGMGKTLSPNLVVYQSPDLPYSQSKYEGHEGFQKWAEEMTVLFSSLAVDDPKFFEREGADDVVVTSQLKLKARATGEMLENPMVQFGE